MIYERALITPPELEPVSKEQAKEHCHVDFDEDDGYIDALITTARSKLEVECSRAFMTQTWEAYPPHFPCARSIKLPLGKLQDIAAFNFVASDGTTTATWTVSGSDLLNGSGIINAHINTKAEPGRIDLAYSKYWPVTILKTSNPITIRFTCGYGMQDAVPAPIKHAILLLVEQWYKNRDIAVVGKSVTMIELPQAVDALIANYRLY